MEGNNNRTNGTRFEAAFARKMAEYGWWVHRMAQNSGGQPADLIAVRGTESMLIDCKVCSGESKGFAFSRIEPNQHDAMDAFTKASGEYSCWFAIKLPDGHVRMMAYDDVKFMEKLGIKQVTLANMKYHTQSLENWLEGSDKECTES